MEKVRRHDGFKIAFVVVLILVLLSSCLCVGTALAWLTQNIDRDSGNNLSIGSVDFDVYYNDSKVTTSKSNASGINSVTNQEITLSGTSTIRTINLKIRNTGTIDAIMRVTISIYQKDANGNHIALVLADATPTIDNSIAMQTDGWVRDMHGVTSGYMYYNQVISPYTVKRITHNSDGTDTTTSQDISARAVSVVSQILVPSAMASDTYYMSITVEGVAYKGNIYQETADKNDNKDYQIDVEAYPFGEPSTLPSGWTAWR